MATNMRCISRTMNGLPVATRNCRPCMTRLLAQGGQMGAYNGWERANWFAQDGDDTSEEATHTWSRSGPWEQRIKEECEAVRDHCGVLDMPGFSRYNAQGRRRSGLAAQTDHRRHSQSWAL